MASRSQASTDYLRAIETLSQIEQPFDSSVKQAGPGGEAYDRAPTPAPPQQQKGKLVTFGERARQVVSAMAEKLSGSNHPAPERSKKADRFPQRAAMFFKHNGVMLGGIAVFAASLFAARRYRQRHR